MHKRFLQDCLEAGAGPQFGLGLQVLLEGDQRLREQQLCLKLHLESGQPGVHPWNLQNFQSAQLQDRYRKTNTNHSSRAPPSKAILPTERSQKCYWTSLQVASATVMGGVAI